MIAFTCSSCGKKIRVKEELAGRKAKCPHCAQVVPIPAVQVPQPAAASVVGGPEEAGPLSSGASGGERTTAQAPLSQAPDEASSAARTPSLYQEPDAGDALQATDAGMASAPTPSFANPTEAFRPATAPPGPGPHQSYDFLAPPRQPDEIGRLGPYRILKVLGAGGMGVVFQAEEPQLKRQVAVKAMLPALAANPQARERFLREAQAAAAVEHDHIIHINQVGEDRGVPFVAMPLLRGESLDDRLKREGKLPVIEVLRIGWEIAEGLAAAHERGLIHRDIKPANVWLEFPRGRVKILDFGLARQSGDDSHLTQTGAILGTPAYMAPEQAQSEGVEARSDLFSLGCVLYRMAGGELPFKGKDSMATLLALVRDQPRPLQDCNPDVPPALADLVRQLLAKVPAGRPASARVVAAALRDIELDRTMVLPPPSPLPSPKPGKLPADAPVASGPGAGRTGRRWLVATAALLLAGVLLAGAVFVLRTKHGTLTVTTAEPEVKVFVDGEEKVTIDSKKVGKVELIPGDHKLTIKRGDEELYSDTFVLKSGGEVVIDARWEPRQPATGPVVAPAPGKAAAPVSPLDRLKPEDIPAAERFDWQPKELVAVLGEHQWRHWGEVLDVAYSADGTLVASAGYDGTYLREVASGRELAFLKRWNRVALAPDGKTLAGGAHDEGVAVLWDIVARKERLRLKAGGEVYSLAFSPDGKTLATGAGDKSLRLWDPHTGKQLAAFEKNEEIPASVTFSPDSRLVAVAIGIDHVQSVKLWDVVARKEHVVLHGHFGHWGYAYTLQQAFSPDGSTLAIPSDRGVQLWDAATGKKRAEYSDFGGLCLRYTPDGKSLVVGDAPPPGRNSLRLLNAATGEVRMSQAANDGRVVALAVSPDGKVVASVGNRSVQLWDVASGKALNPLLGHTNAIGAVAVSPDGGMVASTAAYSRSLTLWDAATGQERAYRPEKGFFGPIAFSPDGKTLAAAGDSGLELRDPATGKILRTLRLPAQPLAVTFAPDGQTLAVGSTDNTVKLWEVNTDKEPATFQGHSNWVKALAYAPDGKTLASGSADNTIKLWDVSSGKTTATLAAGSYCWSLAFSPDGKTLAAAPNGKGVLELWDVESRKRTVQSSVPGAGYAVVFAPDGKVIAIDYEGGVALCHAQTAKVVRTWGLRCSVWALAFAPDGRHLVTGNGNGTVYILRLAPPPEKATAR